MKQLLQEPISPSKDSLKRTFKLELPLDVRIEKEGDLEIEAGEPFVVEGVYSFHSKTQKGDIEWVLPKGVQLLEGEKISSLENIPAHQERRSRVVLISHEEANQKIHFRVSLEAGSQKFSHITQFNTTLQEQINVERAELHQKNLDYQEKSKKRAKMVK
jgi:hypothetical protein